MAAFKKPIILSSGASELHEVQEAVSWINKYDVPLALLHCVLNYPTADENANLGMIKGLAYHFPDTIIGYSDHTLPKDMKSLEAATLLGAVILEKHFSHDKSLPGNDHYHAMDKEDLKVFRKNMDRMVTLLGDFEVHSLPSELPAIKNARRSLVAKSDIAKGEKIKLEHLTWKRPAHGISPKFINDVVGKTALVDIKEDDIFQWNKLS
jgi:N-acetylneuraminate synthase